MSSVRLCWSCYCDNGNNGCQAIEWLIAAATHRYHLEMALVTCYSLHWQAGGTLTSRGGYSASACSLMRRSPRWSWSLLIFGGNEIMITSSGFPGCHLATDLAVNCCAAAKMWQRMPGQKPPWRINLWKIYWTNDAKIVSQYFCWCKVVNSVYHGEKLPTTTTSQHLRKNGDETITVKLVYITRNE